MIYKCEMLTPMRYAVNTITGVTITHVSLPDHTFKEIRLEFEGNSE